MSIVKMKKIKLVALNSDKQNILDALVKTGAIELVESKEIPETFTVPLDDEKNALSIKYDRVNRVIDFITDAITLSKDKDYYPKSASEYLNNFFISYSEFINANKLYEKVSPVVHFVEDLSKKSVEDRAEKIKLYNTLNQLKAYKGIDEIFSDFTATESADVFFGTIKKENYDGLYAELDNNSKFTEIKIVKDGAENVILVVSLKEESETVSKILAENGFNKCPFTDSMSPDQKIYETENAIRLIENNEQNVYKSLCGQTENLKELKIYADYLRFLLEKAKSDEGFRKTEKTFVLEGFVPFDKTEEITSVISGVSNAVYIDFTEPEKDEVVPTLTKNNKAVRQTEFITDMYSVPDYREYDPSHTIFFFFMLFMGVIMADMGYGVLMIIIGLFLSSRIKVDNGTKRLWNIIAIGGIASIIFGFLFNSLFGLSILPFRILPDPVSGGKDSIMLVLLGCLGLGVIQIAVGYFLKAVNCFKDKRIFDGICDGIVWVLFFIGFVFAAFNFILEYLMSDAFVMNKGIHDFFEMMTTPGLIIVGASLVFAAATAGRHERGFGKFSKGFGAIYGLINLMSDILSYARLFGLMLSGMIIAQTFNDIGGGLMSGGVLGIIFGILVILVGHAFNIAMGVLGAYIHDSRLQYIEYFSKFYTGEGEKFKPLGSDSKYVYITK